MGLRPARGPSSRGNVAIGDPAARRNRGYECLGRFEINLLPFTDVAWRRLFSCNRTS